MSRLSVYCPEVTSVLGSGSLVTHSLIAAGTLQAAMWMAAPALKKLQPVRAILRTHTHRGKTTFTFPVLETHGPVEGFEALLSGQTSGAQIGRGSPALEAGSSEPAVATPPAAPPPFDESNEKLVGEERARTFIDVAHANGITGAEIKAMVENASDGRTTKPAQLTGPEWETLRRLYKGYRRPAVEAAS